MTGAKEAAAANLLLLQTHPLERGLLQRVRMHKPVSYGSRARRQFLPRKPPCRPSSSTIPARGTTCRSGSTTIPSPQIVLLFEQRYDFAAPNNLLPANFNDPDGRTVGKLAITSILPRHTTDWPSSRPILTKTSPAIQKAGRNLPFRRPFVVGSRHNSNQVKLWDAISGSD